MARTTIEERVAQWRSYLLEKPAIRAADVDELEDHLREQIEQLAAAGLDEDEALLVAVKRLGDVDSLAAEFAREYSERLWKQLVLPGREAADAPGVTTEAIWALGLGAAAAVAFKLPELLGVALDELTYARNLSLFVLPFLALYFAVQRGIERRQGLWLALPFVAALPLVNWPPFGDGSHTEVLVALHLPIALWLAVGHAYCGGEWRDHRRRMDFVRFSGEWFIYYALIALGGGVLMGVGGVVFASIGVDVEPIITSWVLPCGALGAVLVAAWLVEAKQSVIENMAPVLTRLFTPLFALLLLTLLATMLVRGGGLDVEREVLIGFDLLLALVLGLLLYSISARDPQAPPGLFDALQLLLIVAALAVDGFALWAIAGRISEYGVSPNKLAALGENLVLLVNLAVSALLYARFLARRSAFEPLERWQTAYLPVYAVWAWAVVALFPILFGYR